MASSHTTPVLLTGTSSNQSVYEAVTTARHRPGTRGRLDDGREFEYVRSDDATAIGKGKLATYDPIVAGHDKIAVQAASAIGSHTIAVTVTVTLTKNELDGGFISIDKEAGLGEQYKITGHIAHTSGTLTLTIERPIVVALTTSSVATIDFGPCAVMISTAVTAEALNVEVAAGVPLFDVGVGSTTPQFFWVQKKGRAVVLFGAAVGAVGNTLFHGEVAGAFQLCIEAESIGQLPNLGSISTLLPIDTEYHPVMLDIA